MNNQNTAVNNTRLDEAGAGAGAGAKANQDKVANVTPGNHIKALFGIERLWVEVAVRIDDSIYGFVASEPICPEESGVEYGDAVVVLREDVLDVYPASAC
jgi:hypothetical protein